MPTLPTLPLRGSRFEGAHAHALTTMPSKSAHVGTTKKGAGAKKGKGAALPEETHRCFHCQTGAPR